MMSESLQEVDIWLVHGMLIGQLVFLVVWATLPWWKEWVGRALMLKSVALFLLLLVAVVNYWVFTTIGPYPGMDWVTLGSHVLIFIGIWVQLVAIAHEIRVADAGDRPVSGTNKQKE